MSEKYTQDALDLEGLIESEFAGSPETEEDEVGDGSYEPRHADFIVEDNADQPTLPLEF